MKALVFLSLAVVLILGPLPCSAVRPVRSWTAFGEEDGLYHSIVTGIAQTSDGAAWFATLGGGISRYDGRTWRTYTSADGLPGNAVSSLYVAEDGTLWAVAGPVGEPEAREIVRLVGRRWEPVFPPEDLGGSGVQHIAGVGGGVICFSTATRGILCYEGGRWRGITSESGLASDNVQCVLMSSDGTLWAAHGYGLRPALGYGRAPRPQRWAGGISRLDPGAEEWAVPTAKEGAPEMRVLAVAEGRDGAIWFGSWERGVARFDGTGWRLFTTDDGLPSNHVQALAAGPDGSIWAGTEVGLAVYRTGGGTGGAEGSWEVFTEGGGLPNNQVTTVYTASDGAVWVGTRGGAARYYATEWVHYGDWAGERNRGGVALERDGDGTLWAATGEGLYRLKGDGWDAGYRLGGPGSPSIVDLRAAPGGRMWAATSRELVFRDAEEWRPVALPEGGKADAILSLSPAGDGGVWLGTRSGVYRYDGTGWAPHGTGVVGPVLAICEARDGALWVGLGEGVVRLSGGRERLFTSEDGLPGGPVRVIVETRSGEIWVSTPFEGVARYNGEVWSSVPEGDETTLSGVRRIFEAEDGSFWLASAGDGAIHTDGLTWTRYGAASGLPSVQVWDIAQDAGGRLWFATAGGLARHVPDMEAPETLILGAPEQVAPYQNVLLRFSGQDAWKRTPSNALQFSWRLDAGPWAPYSPEDQVLLSGLRPGSHAFEVRAIDREFNVDGTPARHTFAAQAPIWQRPWFIALSSLSVIALAISSGYALQRNRRWREAQARLIQELESELNMAHDMQMGLLPTEPLRCDRFEVFGRCLPANHVGGDYFHYFWLGEQDRNLAFGSADVSGKAMEAAVRVMQLSGIFRYEFRSGRALAEVLDGLHHVLLDQLDETSFVTGCIGILDPETGRVQLANAAHPYPYLYLAAAGDVRQLEMPSVPLGIALPPGAGGGHAERALQLSPGDALVLYSDGVTDLQDERGEFFGEDRLRELIRLHGAKGAEALAHVVLADLAVFQGSADQVDDVTLLVVRAFPDGGERPKENGPPR